MCNTKITNNWNYFVIGPLNVYKFIILNMRNNYVSFIECVALVPFIL